MRCSVDAQLAVRFYLTMEKGQVTIQPGQEIVIRRSEQLDGIILTDPGITRQPGGIGKFTYDANGLVLTPTLGGNPILVNGAKISETYVVRPGDRIRIGYSVLVVQAL